MKKLVSITLVLCMLVSMVTVADAKNNPFTDVKEDAWYYDEVVKAVDTGIINGKTATEFKPDDLLTYAEAVKLAACMNQVYLNGEVTLANGTPWYKPYADYCKANKIITKDYNYNENATRAKYMEIFANALPDEAFQAINNIPDGSILDVQSSASYAHYVYKLYRAGIVTGVDEKRSCNPGANIKRSEVAAIISRMMDKNERIEFDMPESNGTLSNEGTTDDIIINEAVENITDHESIVVETPNGSTGYALSIYKQPKGSDCEEYDTEYTLEVQVYGGKSPYSYQWFYYTGYKNNKEKIADGNYVKNAASAVLTLSVEMENALLGKQIYCEITDSEGASVTTEAVKVYGLFSMPVDEVLSSSGKDTLVGKVADGILKKGEKVSLVRNGKVVAAGTAVDLQMFNKSLDKTVKGDNVGIVFDLSEGAKPQQGDLVIKYKPINTDDNSRSHEITITPVSGNYAGSTDLILLSEFTVYKQPEGYEADTYGGKHEAEVQVYGGKAPYTYTWYTRGLKNTKVKIENGEFVKGAGDAKLVLSIEKKNSLLGESIYCQITDSEGKTLSTDSIQVYGPFSMPIDGSLNDSGNNILTGRIADGKIKKGDKISVIRNGKVIATGIAADIQMFNKSLDEGNKGDNIGIVFKREKGVRPQSGDVVVKHSNVHVIDTSDIVN